MGHKEESYLDSLLDNVSNSSENLYNNLLNNDANSFQMDDKEIENIDFSDIMEDISFDMDSEIDFDEFDTIDGLEEFEDFDETFYKMDQEFNNYKSETMGTTENLQELKMEMESSRSNESSESNKPSELNDFNDSMNIDNIFDSMSANEVVEVIDKPQEELIEFMEQNENQMNQGLNEDISMKEEESIAPLDFQESDMLSNEEDSPFEDNLMESLLADSPFANDMDLNVMQEINEQDEYSDPMADVEDLLGLLAQEEKNPGALDNLDMFGIDDSTDTTKDQEDVFSIHSRNDDSEEINLQEDDNLLNNSMEELLDTKKKEKKVGFFARIFGNIHDEKARKQNQPKGPVDEDGNPIKKPVKSKEEIAAAKEIKKKAKDELKKEKASKAGEIKAQKAAQKKEKAQAKKEKKMQVVVEEDEGRINRVGATIVFMFFGIVAACIILGTDTFSYTHSITKATEYFGNQKYNSAYNEVRGVEVKDEDHEIYDKIMTVMFVNKQLNSYNNYYNMQMYPEALDSLLKGLQRYDEYISIAKELGIESDLDYVRKQILGELNSIFGLTEDASYSIIKSDNQETYSQKVINAASIN